MSTDATHPMPIEPGSGAPYRSEAFPEDLAEGFGLDDDPGSPPWSWGQAGLAALLCAVPVGVALLGGAAGLLGGSA